ncbi:putative small G-protein Ras2 [Basidiobolus meristosporus CBS 931.73]|uniref:small monomeric GTPase n=1 Tax=Basidiobolus meristosporus CBS 931.73 TaxID=1314790 RepID=A0A1Y1XWX3_9FUNG|nr:putative small G-protein Ras2 [Basidiobolus meristosporus CBS 931.73]|eukprot:ORX89976.1 putative small G-protein Ras2 [Basidiobolus meristosporus CBS 931.73]
MKDIRPHKVVLLGDGAVGKTALTVQLCSAHFLETYNPTIEDCFRTQAVIDKKPCMLEILDTAGQQEFTSLRDQWIREGEGFLLVYCIAVRSTFEHVEMIRNEIARVRDIKKTPILLVGNKCDRNTEREVSHFEGSALAKRLGCHFIESSAKTSTNVERAFHRIVRMMRSNENGGSLRKKICALNKVKSKCRLM